MNYERLGFPEKKKSSLLMTISSFIFFAACFFSFRLSLSEERALGTLYTFYNSAMAIYFYRTQRDLYRRHLDENGPRESKWKGLLLAFVFVLPWFGLETLFISVEESYHNREFARGVQLFEQKNYGEAKKVFEFLTRKYPRTTEIHWNLALVPCPGRCYVSVFPKTSTWACQARHLQGKCSGIQNVVFTLAPHWFMKVWERKSRPCIR